MAIICPACGAQYDVTLFAYDRTILCDCGAVVDARRPHEQRESPLALELRRRADAITSLVLHSDLPRIDLEIQVQRLKEWVGDHFPDRVPLFEMVYEARWARLREQGWEHDRPDL